MKTKPDLRAIILDILNKKGSLSVRDIVAKTGFSRIYVQRFFKQLKDEGAIALVGKANQAHYILLEGLTRDRINAQRLYVHRILRNKNLSEHTVLQQIKNESGIYQKMAPNVAAILDYAFTEMLNNAIEHSQSDVIDTVVKKTPLEVQFVVSDHGIGIFQNIMQKKGLHDHLEAVQDLLKGKQTTAPEFHSGEGIFFTSKVADSLIISSSKKKLVFDNRNDDLYVTDGRLVAGTKVLFSIATRSSKALDDVFRSYTDDSLEFSKTTVLVKLYRAGVDYVSRSQARRIIAGLDSFKTIELDFKGVNSIGQGFADEIFRVWQSQHPGIKVVAKNASPNVLFMIRHVSEK